jgi:N-acetylglucosamine-6-phosphate deacetylase
VTLPLLEGVRRLAQWGVPPEQAIAAATITPRRVLGDQRSTVELLLNLPLNETLRWRSSGETLSWNRAAG